MTFRSRMTPLALLLSGVFAVFGAGQVSAGPIYTFAITDTSSLAGTTGALEFQYTQDLLNPTGVNANAFVSNVQGGTLVVPPSPTMVFSGSPTGDLNPGDTLVLPNLDINSQSADVTQDYTFGNTLTFNVSFDGPGTFYFSVWNQPSADIPPLGSASQEFIGDPGSGAALVVQVDSNGNATVLAAGPGVVLLPEPTMLALFGLGGVGLAVWRLRRRRK